jgi:SH3-like domain-containing protein
MSGTMARTAAAAIGGIAAMAGILWAAAPAPLAAQDNQPPYWASIAAERAVMRRGPAREMQAMWEYRRPGLPIKIVALHEDWRQVQEPDGTTGWMHRSLLSGRRTAIVTRDRAAMRVSASPNAPIAYHAEEGVVGRLGDCDNGWCAFDVLGRSGYIAADHIWGDGAP